MENKRDWLERAAMNNVPNPADFPLGSEASRAAARAMLLAKAGIEPPNSPVMIVERMGPARMRSDEPVRSIGRAVLTAKGPCAVPRRALTAEACCEILRRAGHLPSDGRFRVLRVDRIPMDLSRADLESWLWEHGGEAWSQGVAA